MRWSGSRWQDRQKTWTLAGRVQLFVLYVLAADHGTEAGRSLLVAVIGNDDAALWVADPNPRAQAFYRKHGFKPDGALKHDPDIDIDIDEIRMVRE